MAPSPVDLVSSPTAAAAYTSALDSSPTGMSMSMSNSHASNGHACNGHDSNGHAAANGVSPALKSRRRRRKSVRFVVPPDDDIARGLIEHEYFWQAFPADSPFGTRLGWAFDYYMAWRGAGEFNSASTSRKLCIRSLPPTSPQTHVFLIPGWNWAISCLPRFDRPAEPLSGELVKLDSIPLVSHAGYRRLTSHGQFVWVRLRNVALAYLVLDLCAILMIKDRYFNTGLHDSPPPLYLSAMFPSLPPPTLYVYRMIIGFVGMLAALTAVFSADQLVRRGLARAFGGGSGVRGELWQYPDLFGSFGQMLEHGLAGFWGRYWHQTFRVGFTAPSKWLIRRGWLPARRSALTGLVASACAFFLSGLMHASGAATMPRPTRPGMAFAFFLLAWVGIVLQLALCSLLRRPIAASPLAVRRAGNMLFVLAWMYATCWTFEDDLSRSGLWTFEPVPYSLLRAMGFGEPGDDPARWRGSSYTTWHVGKHWWDSGPAFV